LCLPDEFSIFYFFAPGAWVRWPDLSLPTYLIYRYNYDILFLNNFWATLKPNELSINDPVDLL